MANRTLRRPYTGATITPASSLGDEGTNKHESGDDVSEPIATANNDGISEPDGSDNGGNSDSASSVGYATVDPEQLGEYISNGGSGNNGSSEPERKRRGRKPGSKYPRSASKKVAQDSIEPFLLMVHTIAATMLKTKELELSEEEAKKLSDAYGNFCQHHDIPVLGAKRLSEIQLISCAFMVYVPRLVAIRNNWKSNTRANKAKPVEVINAHIG